MSEREREGVVIVMWKTKIDGELIFIQLSIVLVQSAVSTRV